MSAGRSKSGGTAFFRAALYIRLSREDGDGGESMSVANQRALLTSYAESDESIVAWEEFIDDGYSGTDFDRPAFCRMISRVRKNEFNCVIVKDLSRFGRNYIGAGRYLEEEFPTLGVRFIALSDGIDSYLHPESSDTILLPFKNLLNDEYSRDISKKIRTALDTKRKNGVFIGSKASYGYKRSETKPGAIEPDPEAARIVARIFDMYLGGMSKSAIVRRLNAEGIPSPSSYAGEGRGLWSYSSVDRILRNRVYIGDLVQGRNTNISYKVQKTRKTERDRWFISENTHEPIVSREDFMRAQSMMGIRTRAESTGSLHPLAGLVKCADCGRSLMRRRIRLSDKVYEYYLCPTYRQSKTACTKHSVRVDHVEREVLKTIREEIAASVDFAKVSKELSGAPQGRSGEKKALENKLSQVMEQKRSLYGDWKSGELTKEEYIAFKSGYDAQEKSLREELDAFSERVQKTPGFERLSTLAMPEKLDRALACMMIKKILVHENGDLTVVFNFARPENYSENGRSEN